MPLARLPGWRTRLYADTSVPPTFLLHLKEEFGVEIVLACHLRTGPYRDYLVPSREYLCVYVCVCVCVCVCVARITLGAVSG